MRSIFEITASDFGWICQNQTCWVSFSSGSLESGINLLVQLWPIFFSQFSPVDHHKNFKLHFTGPKPIPTRVQFENGFSLNMGPCAVMEARALALHSFTEEFWHDCEHRDATLVANDVLLRWRSDCQRFPPRAYKARNLVWKGSDPPLWRTLSSAERLAICGFSFHSSG